MRKICEVELIDEPTEPIGLSVSYLLTQKQVNIILKGIVHGNTSKNHFPQTDRRLEYLLKCNIIFTHIARAYTHHAHDLMYMIIFRFLLNFEHTLNLSVSIIVTSICYRKKPVTSLGISSFWPFSIAQASLNLLWPALTNHLQSP